MDKTPLLTIIVPIYNVETYLTQCLESLIDQQVQSDYHVLLIDDCGQDNSFSIAKNFVNVHPRLFTLLQHKKNKGLSAARNTGLIHTHSPYVMYVDSDDWLSKEAISQLVSLLKSQKPDLLFFDFIREYDDWQEPMPFSHQGYDWIKIEAEQYGLLLEKCPVTAWGKVFLTEIAKQNPFVEGIIFEDVAAIPAMLLLSKIKIHSSKIHYHYRQREGSIMSTRRGELQSLFHAYSLLLANKNITGLGVIKNDLAFILLRDWLVNIRTAYREEKYEKAFELLRHGISWFASNKISVTKNQQLLAFLTSKRWISKIKVKSMLLFINNGFFQRVFMCHINFKPISFAQLYKMR